MKKITLLFLFFFSSLSFIKAQDFQGLVVYQSKTSFDIKLDSSRIPPDRQKQIMEMMKRQSEKKYELRFNKTASTYKEQSKLEQPGGQGNFRFFGGGGSANLYYKDTKEQKFANQTDLFGKNFLVKDQLKKIDWKLEKDSKMIGNYLCFKATAKQEIKTRGFRFRPGPPRPRRRTQNEPINSATAKKNAVPKFRTVTAWYTPQIPVNQGPKEYWGLPGLILEVSFDKTMLLATKIVLNPKDKKPLKIPDKGKVVTQAEYNKIMIKKMKEMQQRYRNQRRNRGRNAHFRFN